MMELGKFDERIKKYGEDFDQYGYDPRSMAMPSDRRTIRYEELIKNFTFYKNRDERFTLLDAGCGFGDLIKYLDYLGVSNFKYAGVDAVSKFIEFARGGYSGRENISFREMNYFYENLDFVDFDYAVFSQTFNDLYLDEDNNMALIKDSITKIFKRAKKGVSFNFVTDKVQFKKEGVAYHNPEEVLQFAYSLSNCVFLDNGCMPYECTCTILKNKASNRLVFDMYYERYKEEFDDGVFVVKSKKRAE